MADDLANKATLDKTEKNDRWPPLGIVEPSDFRSIDYNAIVRGLKSVCDSMLQDEYMNAAKNNRSNNPAFDVYRILAAVMSLHFRLNDKSGPYGAQMVLAGKRTSIPEDWRGQQNDHFFEILEEIEHPALRARLADVVWLNDRRKSSAAKIAVTAYCECVEGLIDGNFDKSFPTEREVSLEEVDLIERASQIHSKTSKKSEPMCDRVEGLLNKIYEIAFEHLDIVPLRRVAQLLIRFDLIKMDKLAKDMESAALAAEKEPDQYTLAIKALWDLAAFAYRELKQEVDAKRCQIAGVEQTLAMSQQTGSSSGAAHWHRQAIGELRRIAGTEDRREQIRKDLRALQEKSLEEMGSFNTPIDISDLVTGTIKIFENLTLPEAFRHFALLAMPPEAEEMRKEVSAAETGFSGLFSTTHLDDEGKVIGQVEGAPLSGEKPSEDWIKSKLVEHLRIRTHIAVNGRINPARRVISSMFPLSERHFRVITRHSPFVPQSHTEAFALGFARLVQGDLLSAAHILIPQLENCLRYVLLNNSTDTSKMRNDLTQEDRSISTLLDLYRDEIVGIFGEDSTLCIDLIFNHRPGPALRHEFAHGKVGDASTRDPMVYYGCCFMFLLTCIPLFSCWNDELSNALEAESF